MAKVISFKELEKNKSLLLGKKTVLVGGCFDLIHYGHLQFLKKAKAVGDFLIVALESNEFIKKRKNKIPVHTQRQRAEILASLNVVDLVVLLPFFEDDEDYANMVKKIKPDIIAVTEGDREIQNKKEQAEEVGAKLKVVSSLLAKFSSSQILNHAAIFGD